MACLTPFVHTHSHCFPPPAPPLRRTQHHCDGAGGQGPHFLPGQVRSFLFVKEWLGFVLSRRGACNDLCGHIMCNIQVAALRTCAPFYNRAANMPNLCSGLLTIGPRFGGAIDDAARYFKQACDQASLSCRGRRAGGLGDVQHPCKVAGQYRCLVPASLGVAVSSLSKLLNNLFFLCRTRTRMSLLR